MHRLTTLRHIFTDTRFYNELYASVPKEIIENADLRKPTLNKNNDHTSIIRKTRFRSSFNLIKEPIQKQLLPVI